MLEQQLGFNYQMAHLPRSANSANSTSHKPLHLGMQRDPQKWSDNVIIEAITQLFMIYWLQQEFTRSRKYFPCCLLNSDLE